MNVAPAGPRTLADWLSLAAGLALAAVGVVVILRPETAILRLATSRRAAAVVLVLMGFGRGLVELAYRDTDAALEALAQAVLAAAILGLSARRS